MGSKKQSARRRERDAFRASLDEGGMGDLFAREGERQAGLAAEREEARRWKACERKQRYDSRAEAEAAIAASEAHGARRLTCYRCPYCGGWHLTSHGTRP